MKKVFFGVAVVAIALSASAFTNAKVATGDRYINSTAASNPTYPRLSGTYNPLFCQDEQETACSYVVTTAGAPFVTASSYTATQLENFESLGYVTESTEKGLYIIP